MAARGGATTARPRRGSWAPDDRNVAPARVFEPQRLRAPRSRVVFRQLRAQPPRLDADDRIEPRIVAVLAIEDLTADHEFLHLVLAAGDLRLHREAQEAAEARGAGEQVVGDDAFEMIAYRLHEDAVHLVHTATALPSLQEVEANLTVRLPPRAGHYSAGAAAPCDPRPERTISSAIHEERPC